MTRTALALALGCAACLTRPDPPDGVVRTWRLVDRATEPGPLHSARMVFDASRATVVLHGGITGAFGMEVARGETYELVAGRWQPICGNAPAVFLPALAVDPDGRLVLAGGARDAELQTASDEVWECAKGGTWKQRSPLPEVARVGAHIIRLGDGGPYALVGGRSGGAPVTNVATSDELSSWLVEDVPDGLIAGGAATTVAYDGANNRMLALANPVERFGHGQAIYNTLWEWAGPGGPWRKACDPCSDRARIDAAIVHVGSVAETYVVAGFGGAPHRIDATWVLDRDEWIEVPDMSFGDRDRVAIAYDPARDVVVAYGGNGASCNHVDAHCAETWELYAP